MDRNKVVINDKEYDVRDFTEQQQNLLEMINVANADIHKLRNRLELSVCGREAAVRTLTQTLEAAAQAVKGEAHE